MSANQKRDDAVQIIQGMLAAAGRKGVSKAILWKALESRNLKPPRSGELMVITRQAKARKIDGAKDILFSNDAYETIVAEKAAKNPPPAPKPTAEEAAAPDQQITIDNPLYVRVGLGSGGDFNFHKGVVRVIVILGTITGFAFWWYIPVENLVLPIARAIGWPL